MKKCPLTLALALFSLSAFLLGAQSASANNDCFYNRVKSLLHLSKSESEQSALDSKQVLANLLAKPSNFLNRREIKKFLESSESITSDELIQIVKKFQISTGSKKAIERNSGSQYDIIKEFAKKATDLDGPKLLLATDPILDPAYKTLAISWGFHAIKKPTADDLVAVVTSLKKPESGVQSEFFPSTQSHLIATYAKELPDLDSDQLTLMLDSIDPNSRFKGYAVDHVTDLEVLTPEEKSRAVLQAQPAQPAQPQPTQLSKPIIIDPSSVRDPAIAKLFAISSNGRFYDKITEYLEKAESVAADDLVKILQRLNGDKKGQYSSASYQLIRNFAPKAADLDGAKLVSATNEISDPHYRGLAVDWGFQAIKNRKALDLVDVVTSLQGVDPQKQSWLITYYAKQLPDLNADQVKLMVDSITQYSVRKEVLSELNDPRLLSPAERKTVPFQPQGSQARPTKPQQPTQPSAPTQLTSGGTTVAQEASLSAIEELKAMPGMERIADQLGEVKDLLASNQLRKKQGLKVVRPSLHARFEGNPGTGKTTVARLYARMLRELGYLKGPKGKSEVPFIERGGADFSGYDAVDQMKKAIEEAQGGVLFLDELYAADVVNNKNAKDAMAVLLKEMEDKRDQFVVIATGYSKEMDAFIGSNDGFKRRFDQKVIFEDYDDATLSQILKKVAHENDYHIDDTVVKSVIQKLSRQRGKGFGNAGSIRNVFEAAVKRHGVRLKKRSDPTKEEANTLEDLKTLVLEDFQGPANTSIQDKLSALGKMVGLDDVKKGIRAVVSLLKQEQSRAEHGLKSDRPLLNAVFTGNPGTGKTTVATMYGSLLKDLGYVSNGEFIYIKASDLIGNVVGDSEAKTKAILKRAKGNVLFIDEAYRLFQPEVGGGSSSFGKAALDTLVEEINADANQDMVIILGGYSRQMENMMSANPGLASRFPRSFHFADYTPDQLMGVLLKKSKEKDFEISPEAQKAALAELSLRRSAKDFGNAREVENLLGAALLRQSERLAATGRTNFTAAELKELRPEDFLGPRKSPDDVLAQFDSTPGLTSVKRALRDIKDTHEEAALADINPQTLLGGAYSFEGHSPEEQKKVAGILGELLHSQGILPKASLEVADSADLKGQYIGESAIKTRRLLENSLGKTLIIKDLSAISNPQNPYEKEAIDSISSFLQQNHGKLAVVFSGTPEEVSRFTSLNPQLARTIEHVLEFHDLSTKESVAYLSKLFHDAGKSLSPAAERKLNEAMSHLLTEPGWANAKSLENFKAKILIKQVVRSKRDPGANPSMIEAQDIEAAIPSGLLRQKPSLSGQHDASLKMDESSGLDLGKTRDREAEQVAVATESRKASSHPDPRISEKKEQAHAHEHEHANMKGDELSELGIHISDRSKKIMNGLEDLLDPNDANAVEEMKHSIKQGKLSPRLLERLAKQMQIPLNPANLSRLSMETAAAIQEMKNGAKALQELAKTNSKAKKLIKHYVCLACGRTTCNYMPYTWFTEA